MYPRIIKITTQEQLELLAKAQAEDKHQPLYPTHIVAKGGEVIGCVSILAAPILHTWMHTTKSSSHDSYFVQNVAENIAASLGARSILVPCKMDSPFYAYMEKLGYSNFIKEISLFEKVL